MDGAETSTQEEISIKATVAHLPLPTTSNNRNIFGDRMTNLDNPHIDPIGGILGIHLAVAPAITVAKSAMMLVNVDMIIEFNTSMECSLMIS